MSNDSTSQEKPVAAFTLSLLAGLWMLTTGTMMNGWNWGQGTMGGWMWGRGMMGSFAPAFWWPWFGVVAGIVVLVGAAMLYFKPTDKALWGMVILVVSVLNFLVGMGGFLAGILGVVGGALALTWNPQRSRLD